MIDGTSENNHFQLLLMMLHFSLLFKSLFGCICLFGWLFVRLACLTRCCHSYCFNWHVLFCIFCLSIGVIVVIFGALLVVLLAFLFLQWLFLVVVVGVVYYC